MNPVRSITSNGMKTIERWFFFLFLFALPFQARFVLFRWTNPFNEWTAGFLWGTDILFGILLILWLVRERPKFSRKDIFLAVLLIIAIASVTQALIPAAALYRVIKLAEYVGVYFYFKHNRPSLAPIILSGIFQGLIGIAQYIRQADLGLRLLGESVLDPNATGVAVVAAQGVAYLRAYGTLPHPNLLSAWLMLCLWVFAWWYMRRAHHRLWELSAFALMLFAFYLTFSRVAIGLWGLGSLVLFLLLWRVHRKRLLELAGTAEVVSAVFAFLFWPQIQARLQVSTEDEAVSQRVFYTKLSAESSGEHLWLGIGIGQFVPMLMKTLPHYPRVIYQPTHNVYLLILNEVGIFGFLVFFLFLVILLKRPFQISPALGVLMVAFLALGLFDHFFWTLQQGGLMMWGLLGAVAYDKL